MTSYTKSNGAVHVCDWSKPTIFLILALGFQSAVSWGQTLTVTDGLQLWLQSNLGVQQNANGVTNWADQSGNGNNATQFNNLLQPQLVLNAFPNSGMPAVQFGINSGFGELLNFSSFSQAPTSTVFILYSSVPNGNNQYMLTGSGGGGLMPQMAVNADGNLYMYPFAEGPAAAGTNIAVFAYAIDGTTPTANNSGYFANGTISIFGGSSTSVTPYEGPGGGVSLGGSWTGIGVINDPGYFNGDIAAVLIYGRALTPTETAAVDSYLNQTFFIPEPTTALLVGVGALLVWRRRRTNRMTGSVAHR